MRRCPRTHTRRSMKYLILALFSVSAMAAPKIEYPKGGSDGDFVYEGGKSFVDAKFNPGMLGKCDSDHVRRCELTGRTLELAGRPPPSVTFNRLQGFGVSAGSAVPGTHFRLIGHINQVLASGRVRKVLATLEFSTAGL